MNPPGAPAANEDERRAWSCLLRSQGLAHEALRAHLERCGSAATALADIGRGRAPGLKATTEAPDAARIDADLAWMAQDGHHLLTWLDDDYPALLRDLPRPPLALFVAGDPGVLWQPQIAIVGSRNPSADGRDHARAFAQALARSGLTITSGLAAGVDAAAHEGALAAGGTSIAVTGTGPDLVYPPAHRDLCARIAASGCVATEFPPGTPARPGHFPARNRVIAGLSLGTLVVEAALRSGSLITARLAAESGREVMALPGSIHNPLARGCHRLIRDGARLVETAEEIVAELAPMAARLRERLRAALVAPAPDAGGSDGPAPAPSAARLGDPDYRRLWQALGDAPQPVDVLAARSGLTVQAISSMLLLMELDGLITVGANGRYGRAGRKAE